MVHKIIKYTLTGLIGFIIFGVVIIVFKFLRADYTAQMPNSFPQTEQKLEIERQNTEQQAKAAAEQKRLAEEQAKRQAEEQARVQAEEKAKREAAKVKDLGMTFDQFADEYAITADSFGLPQFYIYDAEFVAGTVKNAYKYNFNSHLSILSSVNRDTGKMLDVGIIATPTSDAEILDMLIAYGMIIATLNPELSADERGQIMDKLYLMPEKLTRLIEQSPKVTYGNVRYSSVFVNEYKVFLLNAQAKDL